MMGAAAARVDDIIAHSGALVAKPAGMAIGLGVLAVVGIAAIIIAAPTGILAVAAVIGLIALANDGAQLGAWLGGMFGEWVAPEIESGTIKSGAQSVFIGKDLKQQARIEDDVECTMGPMMDAAGMAIAALVSPIAGLIAVISNLTAIATGHSHFGAQLAEGCLTIIVEGRHAARVGCKTTCAAWVSSGEKTVIYGKELGVLAGYEDMESETPGLDSVLWVTDWIGAFAGVIAAGVAIVAGVTIGAAAALVAAIVALTAKWLEENLEDKRFGFADDWAPAIEIVVKAASEASKKPGVLPKVGWFLYKVTEEVVTGGANVPLLKSTKRTGELLDPPPKRTVIESTR